MQQQMILQGLKEALLPGLVTTSPVVFLIYLTSHIHSFPVLVPYNISETPFNNK